MGMGQEGGGGGRFSNGRVTGPESFSPCSISITPSLANQRPSATCSISITPSLANQRPFSPCSISITSSGSTCLLIVVNPTMSAVWDGSKAGSRAEGWFTDTRAEGRRWGG